jgi:hypothetical protein
VTRFSVESIVGALNAAGVRYLIGGGLAVVAHGHVRFTADVDLLLDLESQNVLRAIDALEGLGYRPRAPVPFRAFADPLTRQEWLRDKGLTVFSLSSDSHPATEVDLFVETPIDFEAAYRRAERREVGAGVEAVFVGFDDLVYLKEQAGRPIDLDDIAQLKAIRDREGDE